MSQYVGYGIIETHLVVDKRCEGQKVEQIGEKPPYVCIAVFAETFVVKAVYLRDLPRLVVSTEDSDAIAEAKLECDKEGDGLDGVVPAINVVAHEEIVGVR
jgi:hypothetical protein